MATLLVLASAGVASAQDAPEAYETASSVHVSFDSEVGPLVLSARDTDGEWASLGVAPCELTLPRGELALALSQRNHAPVGIGILLAPSDGAHLVGRYESRQTLRELGVGILLGSAVGVLIGIAFAIGGFLASSLEVGVGSLVGASALGIVGGATGIGLATLDDLATIVVL